MFWLLTGAALEGIRVVKFAGTETGSHTIENPILPEVGLERKCVVLAPESIGFGMELLDLSVSKSSSKVNTWDITIDVAFKTIRYEGVKVQQITTTI